MKYQMIQFKYEISDDTFQGNTKSHKPIVDSGHPFCHHQPAICCGRVYQVFNWMGISKY